MKFKINDHGFVKMIQGQPNMFLAVKPLGPGTCNGLLDFSYSRSYQCQQSNMLVRHTHGHWHIGTNHHRKMKRHGGEMRQGEVVEVVEVEKIRRKRRMQLG